MQCSKAAMQEQQDLAVAMSKPSIFLALEQAILESAGQHGFQGVVRNLELQLKVGHLPSPTPLHCTLAGLHLRLPERPSQQGTQTYGQEEC